MDKDKLKHVLEALNYGLNDCVDIKWNTETHYNTFANAIEVIKDQLNTVDTLDKSKHISCSSCKWFSRNDGYCDTCFSFTRHEPNKING